MSKIKLLTKISQSFSILKNTKMAPLFNRLKSRFSTLAGARAARGTSPLFGSAKRAFTLGSIGAISGIVMNRLRSSDDDNSLSSLAESALSEDAYLGGVNLSTAVDERVDANLIRCVDDLNSVIKSMGFGPDFATYYGTNTDRKFLIAMGYMYGAFVAEYGLNRTPYVPSEFVLAARSAVLGEAYNPNEIREHCSNRDERDNARFHNALLLIA